MLRWDKVDSLKMLHSARFDLNLAVQNITSYITWLDRMENLSDE